MKPRRTPSMNGVLRLAGGNEDNDLWYRSTEDTQGAHVFSTTWEPTPEERAAIADGANVELLVWGTGHPPVAMAVTDEPLGKGEPA